MLCRQYRYPGPSLATSPYRSSPLAGLQGYIPYPHRAAVCMFEQVILLLLGHMWGGSIFSTFHCNHLKRGNENENEKEKKSRFEI